MNESVRQKTIAVTKFDETNVKKFVDKSSRTVCPGVQFVEVILSNRNRKRLEVVGRNFGRFLGCLVL